MLLAEGGLELGGRDHAKFPVQATAVEPVNVLEDGVLDVLEAALGLSMTDQLGLVQTVEGFGRGVVAIAP